MYLCSKLTDVMPHVIYSSTFCFQLLSRWIERCGELEIPVSADFSVIDILATNYEIREWNTYGLPRDNVSTENAVLVTRGRRWPLMIDPQEQVSSRSVVSQELIGPVHSMVHISRV